MAAVRRGLEGPVTHWLKCTSIIYARHVTSVRGENDRMPSRMLISLRHYEGYYKEAIKAAARGDAVSHQTAAPAAPSASVIPDRTVAHGGDCITARALRHHLLSPTSSVELNIMLHRALWWRSQARFFSGMRQKSR